MSNEIHHRHTDTGDTLYACLRKPSTNEYWDNGNSTWETLVPGNWTDYAIDLTETPAGGYVYIADLPASVASGGDAHYVVEVFEQSGSDPAITDTQLAAGLLDWSDSEEVTFKTLDALIDAIQSDTNELQAMFDDVDSTGTETITAAKALELILAIVGNQATYDSATQTWMVKGRDGSTTLMTITLSNTVKGTRTASNIT